LHDLGIVVSAISADDEEGVLSTLGDGEENGSNEGLAIMRLLEDGDLLS